MSSSLSSSSLAGLAAGVVVVAGAAVVVESAVGAAACCVEVEVEVEVGVEVEVEVGLGAASVAEFVVDVVVGLAGASVVVVSAVGVGISGSLDEDPDADEEEEEDEEPGALEESEGSGELVDEGVDAVDAALVDVDDAPESGPPSALRTLARYPSLAYNCVTSHIITPPKLSNFFVYWITSVNFAAGMYPVLAAVVSAGTPSRTLTFLFFETVLAQLSHSSKLYLELVASLLKLLTPQKLL